MVSSPPTKFVPGTVVTSSFLNSEVARRSETPPSYVVWFDGTNYHADSMIGTADVTPGVDAATVANAAIALMPSGGHLHIKDPRTYVINTPININQTPFTLSGNRGVVLQPGNATTDVIQINQGEVEVYGLKIAGPSAGGQTAGAAVSILGPAGGGRYWIHDLRIIQMFDGIFKGTNAGNLASIHSIMTETMNGSSFHQSGNAGGDFLLNCVFAHSTNIGGMKSAILWDTASGYSGMDLSKFVNVYVQGPGVAAAMPHVVDLHGASSGGELPTFVNCWLGGSNLSAFYVAPASAYVYTGLKLQDCLLGFSRYPFEVAGAGAVGDCIMRDVKSNNNLVSNYILKTSAATGLRLYDWFTFNGTTGVSAFPQGTITPVTGVATSVEYPAIWNIVGGTVSDISIAPWGSSTFVSLASATGMTTYLEPGTQVKITFTVQPTVNVVGL